MLVLVLLVVGACGGGGGGDGEGGDGSRPTISPTRTPTGTLPSPTGSPELPSPTRTPTRTPTQTDSPVEPPEETPTQTDSPEEPPEETPTEAEPVPEPEPTTEPTTEASPDASESAGDAAAEEEGVPRWAWWLLALLVVGAAVGIPLAVRARRRGAWRQELAAAESEVAWFARALLPELRRVGSPEQLAGGWAVGEPRVVAAEDRLTGLESTAPDDPDRERARSLRDAVRKARGRLQQLAGPGPHDTWALDVDAVMADLEGVLGERRSRLRGDGAG